jgi:hypothetical protein
MKLCDGCKHARWKLNIAGRLHPDKTGICAKALKWVAPPIPACSYWLGTAPQPSGFMIKRGVFLKEHCVFWEKET